MSVRLGIAVHAAGQRVRERVARVQRIVGIAVERKRSVECRAVGLVHRRLLQVNAELQIVLPADLRVVVHEDPHVVPPEIRETRIDVELRGVRNARESRVGHHAVGVGGRKELRNIQVQIRAPVPRRDRLPSAALPSEFPRFTPKVTSLIRLGLNVWMSVPTIPWHGIS